MHKKPSKYMWLIAKKNLHNCNYKSIVITHARMYVSTLVFAVCKLFC